MAIHRWSACIILACMASGCATHPKLVSESGTTLASHLEAPGLDEVSGMAASRIRPDVLWAIADSGNPPVVYAVGTDGAHRGAFLVEGVDNRDWEDLASFQAQGQSHLVIADTGDNDARYPTCFLHIVREPELTAKAAAAEQRITVERTIRFVYEDGPRDCEAVAVEPDGRHVLLLTKREVPVSLYRLSLEPTADHAIATAQKIADVPQIPRPTSGHRLKNPRYGRYGSQVTAMDIARDGSAAMILTYSHAYRFPRNSGESWEDVFRKSPEPIPLPPMRQAESVCFAPDGTSIYVTSEQRPNPLHRLFLELPGGD